MVFVRVPRGDPTTLTSALDAGAAGIILPHTETAQDVRDLIKEVYYRKLSGSKMCPSLSSSYSPMTANGAAPLLNSPHRPALLQPLDVYSPRDRPVPLPG